MRLCVLSIMLLVASATVEACPFDAPKKEAPKIKEFDWDKMEVGQVGLMPQTINSPKGGGRFVHYSVAQVLSQSECLVKVTGSVEFVGKGRTIKQPYVGKTFVLQTPTEKLVDNSALKLEGVYRVEKTQTLSSGQTFFYIVTHKP